MKKIPTTPAEIGITPENLDSFHFHGDLSEYPITAVITRPRDRKSSALLQGRYQGGEERAQIVPPLAVMEGLLDTILTVQKFVIAGAILVGIATLASAALVFLLSLRLRKREIQTLFKIGGSRMTVGAVMASEIVAVLVSSAVLAGGLTLLTRVFGALAIRAWIRM